MGGGQRWAGPDHAGQGLCWGRGKALGAPAEDGPEGFCSQHSLPVTAKSAYTTGTRNTGQQTPTPETSTLYWRACRTHRSDFNFSTHDGFVPPQAWLLTS